LWACHAVKRDNVIYVSTRVISTYNLRDDTLPTHYLNIRSNVVWNGKWQNKVNTNHTPGLL